MACTFTFSLTPLKTESGNVCTTQTRGSILQPFWHCGLRDPEEPEKKTTTRFRLRQLKALLQNSKEDTDNGSWQLWKALSLGLITWIRMVCVWVYWLTPVAAYLTVWINNLSRIWPTLTPDRHNHCLQHHFKDCPAKISGWDFMTPQLYPTLNKSPSVRFIQGV